jgi:hypothetical protein
MIPTAVNFQEPQEKNGKIYFALQAANGEVIGTMPDVCLLIFPPSIQQFSRKDTLLQT